MAVARTPLEIKLHGALQKIAVQYDSAARLRKVAETHWGVSADEAIEMSYENIQAEAKAAIKGVRVSKPKPL